MSLNENAAPILALALRDLLGAPSPGSMAFIRCLPGEVARELAADRRLSVEGWRIAVVGRSMEESKVTLYADRIKQMAKFKAWFYSEGMRTPMPVALSGGR